MFSVGSASGSDIGEMVRAENECANPVPIYFICVSVPAQSNFTLLAN